MRSPGGGELSLTACRGWGIDRQVRKKLQIPGGVPRRGMVTGRIEPCIRSILSSPVSLKSKLSRA